MCNGHKNEKSNLTSNTMGIAKKNYLYCPTKWKGDVRNARPKLNIHLLTKLRFDPVQRIPMTAFVVDQEQQEQEHIVGNHTSPCGNECHTQQLGADEGADNTDSPHAQNVKFEWCYSFADA